VDPRRQAADPDQVVTDLPAAQAALAGPTAEGTHAAIRDRERVAAERRSSPLSVTRAVTEWLFCADTGELAQRELDYGQQRLRPRARVGERKTSAQSSVAANRSAIHLVLNAASPSAAVAIVRR
jgi:hypothetical protein